VKKKTHLMYEMIQNFALYHRNIEKMHLGIYFQHYNVSSLWKTL